MPSIGRGESSTGTDPILDVFTFSPSDPEVLVDVELLEFRIFDISTVEKRTTPVQVHPLPAGTFIALDPTQDEPAGHRLGTVGHFYAPYTVPSDEELGDHLIEWRIRQNAGASVDNYTEEFVVTLNVVVEFEEHLYCTVEEIRDEGFNEKCFPGLFDPLTGNPFSTTQFDARVLGLIRMASRYVDRVTGRWFSPRTFGATNRFLMDGKESRTLHLEIPIIRLDKLFIENQGLLSGDLTEIDIAAVRIYNRHLSGMTQPDDRENPAISFIQTRILTVTAGGLFPPPRKFPMGRQSVHLEGVFGYTDPDGTPLGETPALIRQATCRLVQRDILLDRDACAKLNVKQKYRIVSDKEGSTTIRLQNIWLKGALTGDAEIDSILMSYKRPPRMGVA